MINFIKKRRLWYSFSLIVIGIGLVSMIMNYKTMNHVFNLGIDFTGGTSITLRFNEALSTDESDLRNVLASVGLKKHTIQTSGLKDIVIKTQEIDVPQRNQLFNLIKEKIGDFDVLEVDIIIGPSIGDQLRKTSLIIGIVVSIAILIYCSWRFEFVFGLASIVALLHDALILLCLSALFKLEMNVAYVAALLTVLGYSINDTIVPFDRIREKLRREESEDLSKTVLNSAVNEMVPRSIHTDNHGVGGIFHLFFWRAIPSGIFVGVNCGLITGTYSSLFIASPMVLTISKLKGVQIGQ